MTDKTTHDVTALLRDWCHGNQTVKEELFALVYDALRKIARGQLSRERADHTLQPTALVHEAYLRLIDQTRVEWQNRAQFMAVASQMMRRILVDHARAKHAERRGGGVPNVTFEDGFEKVEVDENLVKVHDALEALEKIDPQGAKVVELRYFGGLTIEECAEVMGTSASTVKRDWAVARTWLFRELGRQ